MAPACGLCHVCWMNISERGVRMIRNFEGCRLTAYPDVGGVWTIGVGHTGAGIVEGLTWTQDQADAQLHADLQHFVDVVRTAVKVQVTQPQFDSLVSLCFNIGAVAFAVSTLVRKLNAGDVRGAACQFAVWHNAGGVYQPALLLRRAAELYYFAGGA